MAEAITVNAKASRPSACNAAEQLLVHASVAEKFLPAVARALHAKNVQLRCDPASLAILTAASAQTNIELPTSNSELRPPASVLSALSPQLSASPASALSALSPQPSASLTPAAPVDYTSEFLDYIIAIRVVDSLDTAIATINRDSSNHSDAIVTADEPAARRFLASVDSATVYWNASTRFTDGFEFGYGAEIGISTDRLHARGPMGLKELCTYKYLLDGTGQTRA
jgi:glutamate-5-semialdehyde dehydrogenase